MTTKQSLAAMIRLLEQSIRNVAQLPKQRYFLSVSHLNYSGSPPSSVEATVTLRFLAAGGPFCCGEPSCHTQVDGGGQLADIAQRLARRMNLTHPIELRLKLIPIIAPGACFTAGHTDPNPWTDEWGTL